MNDIKEIKKTNIKRKNGLKANLALFFSFSGIFIILVNSKAVSKGAISGLSLTANVLIPSLFPFCVIALFLINSNLILKTAKYLKLKGAVFLLSVLGGYPSGSIVVNELYKKEYINKKQAENLLCFCVNSGPLFILFAVGNVFFNNINIGIIFLSIHILSSFIIMLFFKIGAINYKAINSEKLNVSLSEAFFKSLSSSCDSFLKITGTVVLSSSLFFCFKKYGFAKFILALCEVTVGIKENVNNIYFCIFLLGFSGFSVILQILYFSSEIKINALKIVFFRFVHGFLSALLLKLYFFIFPKSISVISNCKNINLNIKEYCISAPSAISVLILCVMFIIYISKDINNDNNKNAKPKKNIKNNSVK